MGVISFIPALRRAVQQAEHPVRSNGFHGTIRSGFKTQNKLSYGRKPRGLPQVLKSALKAAETNGRNMSGRSISSQPVAYAFVLLAAVGVAGCGSREKSAPIASEATAAGPQNASRNSELPSLAERRPLGDQAMPSQLAQAEGNASSGSQASTDVEQKPSKRRREEPRSLADLLEKPDGSRKRIPDLPRIQVDEDRAAAAGIRKLTGRRLMLFTDLPPQPEVDELPAAFDQAFDQWCAYFEVDPARHADWSMTAFLIQDKDRFQQASLMPDYLPNFQNGFSWNYDLWLYEQPSGYYRRHLLLHEGIHGFMNTILGSCGPPWYMEGIAELLATHRWQDGRLELGTMPADRNEVPMWGRIKVIKDAYAERRAWHIKRILEYAPDDQPGTDPYAWCWGLATLLDKHPAYRERFRRLQSMVTVPDFTQRFCELFADDWAGLSDQWQVLVADLEYGYDVARNAVDFALGQPLAGESGEATIAADRGWQNSGFRLEAGKTYRLRASGRYQVADEPKIWWCEPGGVSIRYYHGRPLGLLLAAVRPDNGLSEGLTPLVRPVAVGLHTDLTPEHAGTLYLRINDSAAELGDNSGTVSVEISESDEES